jgi:hypothetical protein
MAQADEYVPPRARDHDSATTLQSSFPLTLYHRQVDILVIGAGPTGLGAAKRLNQVVSLPYTANAR